MDPRNTFYKLRHVLGGKRINFTLKRSYLVRAEAAVLSYISKGKYHRILRDTFNVGCKLRHIIEKEKINKKKVQLKDEVEYLLLQTIIMVFT